LHAEFISVQFLIHFVRIYVRTIDVAATEVNWISPPSRASHSA